MIRKYYVTPTYVLFNQLLIMTSGLIYWEKKKFIKRGFLIIPRSQSVRHSPGKHVRDIYCILLRLILLYKGLKGKARIPTDDLIPKNRRCRNQLSLAFQIPSASKEAYKSSFFPQTIRDWNDLPDSLVSSAEMSDDCVSKFASLVRSRD